MAGQKRTLSQRISDAIRSQRGRNAVTFGVFLIIATVLWMLVAMNDERTVVVSCPVNIVNIPPEAEIVSPPADAVNVKFVGSAWTLLKYTGSNPPVITIDFDRYSRGTRLHVSESEIKALASKAVANKVTPTEVSPDTLGMTVSFPNP